MNLSLHKLRSRRAAASAARAGFTLPELLIAITVFILLLGGILSSHLFGLSLWRITETKLNATEDARRTLGKLVDEVQTCNSGLVGTISNGVFVALLDGQPQQGSGLLIYPSSSRTNFIIYFINPTDKTFRRTTSKAGTATVLADSVTNSLAFRAQDYLGNVATNNQGNRVFHLNLEFYQPRRTMQGADYYKLETTATRRAL